jgi:hypothetical protein
MTANSASRSSMGFERTGSVPDAPDRVVADEQRRDAREAHVRPEVRTCRGVLDARRQHEQERRMRWLVSATSSRKHAASATDTGAR